MPLGKRLQRWWDLLLGRPRWYRDDVTTRKSVPRAGPPEPTRPGELSLATDLPQARKKTRHGEGIDPYANDAGYAKPHSWERIDHD